MIGDSARSLKLDIRNSFISEEENSDFTEFSFEGRVMETPAFFNVNMFDVLELHDVIIQTNSKDPAVMAKNGNRLVLENIQFLPSDDQRPLIFENVGEVVQQK